MITRADVSRGGSALPRFIGRAALAIVGGLLLWLSFPTHDLWWAAPLGVAALAGATLGPRPRTAFLLGLLGGLAYFVPTLSWSGIFVGWLPWFALATLEALYVAAMCLVTAWVWRGLRRRGHHAWAYAAVPLAWVVQETARGHTPFGGFPWARLAFSQADSPLATFAAYGGAPLVTFMVAVGGTALLAVVRHLRPLSPAPVAAGVALLAVLPLTGGLISLPTDGREVTVALVQGNVPRPGLDFNAERRAVLDNHVQGTFELARSGADPDLVIWPENAADIDPLRNADARQVVRAASEAVDVPLLIGAILNEPAPKVSNASLFYRPGETDSPEKYVKQHPVPFAEYVPYRDFFRLFSDKVEYVREGGFAAGEEPAAFRVGEGGDAWYAIPTICFEVAYDGLVREAVMQEGAQPNLLVVQTNNATFGYSAESEQQLAISRIRAIEHGRSVAHVSTVGVSALIHPDGSVHGATELFTAEQVVGDVVVRSGITVADRIGYLPEVIAGLGLAALLAAAVVRPRGDRVGRDVAAPPEKESLRV